MESFDVSRLWRLIKAVAAKARAQVVAFAKLRWAAVKAFRFGKKHLFLLAKLAALGIVALLALPLCLGINPFARIPPESLVNQNQAMRVYAADGTLAATRSGLRSRVYVPLDELPNHLIKAFICSEDNRFYGHMGIDLYRIGGALVSNLKSGSRGQGASTITQQLVKNSLLSQEKTYTRKLREAVLAVIVEGQYTKDEIMELYLNNAVYFGRNAYCIETAAQNWFGVSACQLTLTQSALLAAIMPSPGSYAPDKHPDTALARRDRLLRMMYRDGHITADERDAATAEPIITQPYDAVQEGYGFYVDEVIRQATDLLGISGENLLCGGYQIHTGLIPDRQSALEALLFDPATYPADDIQSAGVLLNPHTGAVVALVGGREYAVQRGLNRATQSLRQPGSAIKPVLVYAPAVEYSSYVGSDFLLDVPVDYAGWIARNPDGGERGWVTVRQAIALSYNPPAVRALAEVGLPTAKLYAQRVGINFAPTDNHLALALGSFSRGVTPLALCGAYAPFANGGMFTTPWLIDRIVDAAGQVVYQRPDTQTRVLSRQSAYIMSDLLCSVTSAQGTGRAFAQMGVTAAGKTGTVDDPTSGNRDAWMVAYTQELCGVVWMGMDGTGSLPGSVVGGSYPARAMATLLSQFGGTKVLPTMPEGLQRVTYSTAGLAALQKIRIANRDPEGVREVVRVEGEP